MIQPRWYQQEAVDSIYSYFGASSGNPLVVIPTGAGKSLVITLFTHSVLQRWHNQRFLILSHVKEILDQDYKSLRRFWPQAPAGIFSAGLGRREHYQPIVFAGIATAVNNEALLGHRDIIIVDECHLISTEENSNYIKLLKRLKEINPAVKIIGLTATAFRMGLGMLTDGGIFTDIAYDLSGPAAMARLIAEGYLAPLVPKKTQNELDVSNVKISRATGDYQIDELQAAVDQDHITVAAINELCRFAYDRRKWLIFASGIEHAEHISEKLNGLGFPTAAIHSKMPDEERDRRMNAFREGRLRCVTNNNVLTTGVDVPDIDCIGVLRPTRSTVLHVQMLGRGMRPFAGKQNCLVLDFAKNVPNLGPIDDPVIPKKKGEGTGDVPVKICGACGCYNHTRVKYCVHCGHEFMFAVKISKTAGTANIISAKTPKVEYFDVSHVTYGSLKTKTGKTCLKVQYVCGLKLFSELVFVEQHETFAGKIARDWWRQRSSQPMPLTVTECLNYTQTLRKPRQVRVWVNKGKYPEVLASIF